MRGGARPLLSGDGLSARDVAKKVLVALGLATLGSGAVFLNLRLAAVRGEPMRLELGLVRLEGAATAVVFLLILLVVLVNYDPRRD